MGREALPPFGTCTRMDTSQAFLRLPTRTGTCHESSSDPVRQLGTAVSAQRSFSMPASVAVRTVAPENHLLYVSGLLCPPTMSALAEPTGRGREDGAIPNRGMFPHVLLRAATHVLAATMIGQNSAHPQGASNMPHSQDPCGRRAQQTCRIALHCGLETEPALHRRLSPQRQSPPVQSLQRWMNTSGTFGMPVIQLLMQRLKKLLPTQNIRRLLGPVGRRLHGQYGTTHLAPCPPFALTFPGLECQAVDG